MPYLVSHQARPQAKPTQRASSLTSSLPSAEALAHGTAWQPGRRQGWWTGAFLAHGSHYCARANTLAAYADVNR